MKIGEFAKRSGVTVKALLHYDKIGLLKPSEKTDCGYRIYCEEDFLKLQQITTLKFIGLSLSEISHILDESGENLENMISIQKKALEEKKKHIESVISVFNKAESKAKENGFLDAKNLINIIKMTNMERSVKEQYKSDRNLNLRSNLHSYNTNKVDWDIWCFNQIKFPKNAKVLELGCGPGKLWRKNKDNIDKNLNIILSDFSRNMLKIAKEKLKNVNHKFEYKEINAEEIPYEDESFDVVIAQHMIYFVPNIEKALSEVNRVLKPGGMFYVTANSCESMAELNELSEAFEPNAGLSNNGFSARFDLEKGKPMLEKYFDNVSVEILNGKIIVDNPKPVVSYKASTIQGSLILDEEKKEKFTKYLEDYINKNGNISITTKTCMFKAHSKK
ncbi:MerR family transcriptional regulator [Clostridium saccharobutylicum]|uniref:Methyltransferase type 11 n=2 Tax=Clostridium saccharobutylicum TaxID=169679 RepID=U5MSV2_CLOSA|nr:methyltransferase domain-containing protein [Clostridium saccharobutylicum]AGX42512.1 methyltransferase type 11 [Clostridium saccharobutylicum DSM 13864]AQR89798.1 HTH-type transcriptional activator mta [Clostridium saccharobutylicum]AQR99700.1 HTH-type transcriptional activator mta [Clostridium saccharobutylicum]AQS09430.1 HTH-type transcriptional activator mta [Clostridium saccharobutylicum]AQS13686.1 HTH-type transcriptional activator mta [Clostridium saccharobutylicum]